MFEPLLLGGKASKRYHPDSGPGSPFYVGDESVGYFGEVPQAEVFTMQDIKAMVPSMTLISAQNAPYLKFLYYGKVLFIKKMPGVSVRWSDLYTAGMIYGPDGKNNSLIRKEEEQVTVLKKNNNRYYLRTITSDEFDISTIATPSSSLTYVNDDKVRRRSMFTDLIYRVMSGIVDIYPEKKFEKFGPGEAMYSTIDSFELSREITQRGDFPAEASPVLRIDKYNGVQSRNFTSALLGWSGVSASAFNWRPVLEYIPAEAPIQISLIENNFVDGKIDLEPTANAIVVDLGNTRLEKPIKLVNKSNGPDGAASVSASPVALLALKRLKSSHTTPSSPAGISGIWIP